MLFLTRFEVESSGPEQIILHPTLSYGDYSFHPVEDEKVPKTICRDVPKEFRISQILTKYFNYKDPQTKDLMTHYLLVSKILHF